ncbi:isoprenylcysteine carboxylmethyltransferase family protein [Pseudenhygromyxa sp. WMMC2535]|uniref:isoprenylcysteine carboxyl methyltransferase family protein n=1 Tax=Pseudenhygromyxa sp. WMMC2535 TaxID=2712867 RepID=UPI0031F99B9D
MLALVAVQRVAELRLAKRNLARALASGGRLVDEPWYPLFFVLHAGWLIAWLVEGWLRGPSVDPLWPAWAAGFALASALRYWAITSLGPRWNTRIVVHDGAAPVRRGPYALLAHPNYLAVALELACAPMIFGAWITALVCTALNAALLLGLRIPAEIAAVRQAASTHHGSDHD